MTENDAKIVDALRCDGYRGSKCDACGYNEYKVNGGCYGRLLENDAADLIERQSAEIDRLAQENAELRDQAYNLTLYLKDCFDSVGVITEEGKSLYEVMEDKFDGLPGYAPQCVEEC